MSRDPDDTTRGGQSGVSRRGFIATIGTSAVAAAAVASAGPAEAAPDIVDGAEMVRVALDINGRLHRMLVEPRWSLLFVLRERLGLTGQQAGLRTGRVRRVHGAHRRQAPLCLHDPGPRGRGTRNPTVEGLMHGEELGPTQQAFVEKDGFQCGYCTPGQVMAVEGLLKANPNPTIDEIRQGVCGQYLPVRGLRSHLQGRRPGC